MRLGLQRLWQDDDGMLQLQLRVALEHQALSQEFYAYPEGLREFGGRLVAFPCSNTDSPVFEYGANSAEAVCWVRMRAYMYDGSGHSALEFITQNNLQPPAQASAVFSAKLEAASLNRLGHELVLWLNSKEPNFEFEEREA